MTHHLSDPVLEELDLTEIAYRFHQAIGRTADLKGCGVLLPNK
jgi:hypothetical protein